MVLSPYKWTILELGAKPRTNEHNKPSSIPRLYFEEILKYFVKSVSLSVCIFLLSHHNLTLIKNDSHVSFLKMVQSEKEKPVIPTI